MGHEAEIFGWFAFIRAVHFAACLLIFGVWAFDRFVVAGPENPQVAQIDRPWRLIARRLILLALPIALISGVAWFGVVAINMSGLPIREALAYDNLNLVWNTQFGRLWKLRAVLWLGAVAGSVAVIAFQNPPSLRRAFTWFALISGGFLAASLAWSGHGQDGDAAAPWHLAADALHILIGGFWPVGLLPFAILLFRLLMGNGQSADDHDRAARACNIGMMTRRFSALSLASVGILSVTGLVNSWYLVGPIVNLYHTHYGQVLMIKVGLFIAAVAIGAVNLRYLKPRLSATPPAAADQNSTSAARRLLINVSIEIALTTAILVVIGILGLLQPGVGMD